MASQNTPKTSSLTVVFVSITSDVTVGTMLLQCLFHFIADHWVLGVSDKMKHFNWSYLLAKYVNMNNELYLYSYIHTGGLIFVVTQLCTHWRAISNNLQLSNTL